MGNRFTGCPPAVSAPRACPACAQEILPDRWRWRSLPPVTERCPSCRTRIGPYPLLAELVTGFALAVLAARASSVGELAALPWLALFAVPLAFIDVAVRRLPDPLTAVAFAGTLALLAAAALTGHQPGLLGRAAIGAVALAGFYLALAVLRPGGLGLGEAKLAASTGAALGWISWQALLSGTFAAFALAGVYGGALLAPAPGNPHQPPAARAVHPARYARGHRLVTAAEARSRRSPEDIARRPPARPGAGR